MSQKTPETNSQIEPADRIQFTIPGHIDGISVNLCTEKILYKDAPNMFSILRVLGIIGAVATLSPIQYKNMLPELNLLLPTLRFSEKEFNSIIVPQEFLQIRPENAKEILGLLKKEDYRVIIKTAILLLQPAIDHLSQLEKEDSYFVLRLINSYHETQPETINQSIADAINEALTSTKF